MIKCPNCQAKHPENTVFCEQCGAYLLGDKQEETDPMGFHDLSWMQREETSGVPGTEVTSPLALRLTIPGSERDMEVPLTKAVTIGRLDAASDSFPDVDLTSDAGLERGISRRHAKVTRQGREVLIEDLGSINGTFLNGEKLKPYSPTALKSGDELQLGKLMLRVSFTK